MSKRGRNRWPRWNSWSTEISNLRVFNRLNWFKSPRLHHNVSLSPALNRHRFSLFMGAMGQRNQNQILLTIYVLYNRV
jgi:hypothetical protein